MTNRQDGPTDGASSGVDARSDLEARWAALATRRSPDVPDGPAATLLNRVMVYTQASRIELVRPFLDRQRSGLVIAGVNPRKGIQLDLASRDRDVVFMIDPAVYDGKDVEGKEKYTATCDAPFRVPEGRLWSVSLGDVLDEQLEAGAATALTPSGFIATIDVLKAAVEKFKQLKHSNAMLVVPLHISLLGPRYFSQTLAVLQHLEGPVALALGRQGDPLDQNKQIIPNLRTLAATIPLMPIRTDFNALDLVAHGAFAGAIGTGGSLRHAIDPTEKPFAFSKNPSPSVLIPELACFWKGSKIAEEFGARPGATPRCFCTVCSAQNPGGQRLSRFLSRDDQEEAIVHAIAVWSTWARDILDAPTIRDRAIYWRKRCKDAVDHHTIFSRLLNRLEEFKPQSPVEAWATLPAWPTDVVANA
ncbi:hypothetical protein EDD27_1506 [Nonomuraea polychroma]|uniref:tRNA-guanine family transglycosylase n=1 Tax=Nonomuraea polychroma TaxID=46176 RepID=A0A438M038_9ACTN|nr:hypothetical protein [Nonomuraea polychroma]RVX39159.1 hypothetical protein EDD27_1506 [Nonomuraea polychroma]